MREILFRGKRLDNGEWVYWNGIGLVTTHTGKYYKAVVRRRYGETYFYHAYQLMGLVDKNTIGQYTGLKDRNGKRIFEGDIVHCVARIDDANCVVIFEDGEFRFVPERNYKTYTTGMGYHALRCFDKEIVGNIHDNPELLEGDEP